MNSRNFPTGVHYFPDVVADDGIYVDKTQFIVPLLAHKNKRAYFLSRPRRFGKSMFVSTLEHVFLGRKDLFEGLYIYDKIEWTTYPIIRISMDKIGFMSLGLEQALFEAIGDIAREENLQLEKTTAATCFEELIKKLYKKHQKGIVVLIDEYDKPIIQYVENYQSQKAETHRDILKSFFGVLKDSGQYLRFTFITGVSKFSKVSIFSDLNYVTDLTLDTRFAAICGFTEAEIRQYCYGGLEDLAVKEGKTVEEIIAKMQYWYNGFSWNAHDFIYNPYSTMLLMDAQAFDHYWFSSGTPTFLVKLINKDYTYKFDNLIVSKEDYDWYDLQNLDYISLMLQTGYLTFKKDMGEGYFEANYPNKEVEKAFSKMLLEGYTHKHPSQVTQTMYDMQKALERHDLASMIKILEDLFKTLPSQFFQEDGEITDKQGNKKTIRKAVGESFYHAIVYLIFNILGVRMNVEVAAREGRIDAVVETQTHIYIFEFKKNRTAQAALKQIMDNNYADRFALSKKKIYLIGISFSLQKRGISGHAIVPYP